MEETPKTALQFSKEILLEQERYLGKVLLEKAKQIKQCPSVVDLKKHCDHIKKIEFFVKESGMYNGEVEHLLDCLSTVTDTAYFLLNEEAKLKVALGNDSKLFFASPSSSCLTLCHCLCTGTNGPHVHFGNTSIPVMPTPEKLVLRNNVLVGETEFPKEEGVAERWEKMLDSLMRNGD